MNKKIDNLKELEYYTNYNLVSEVILKLKKKYPDNITLNDSTIALVQIGYYVQNLISDRYFYNQSLSEYRSDKIRAVERARTAEKKVIDLEEEIQKLKTKIDVGI